LAPDAVCRVRSDDSHRLSEVRDFSLVNFMNFLGILKLTLSTLSKHILRAVLSIVGVVLGVAAVVAMLSIGEGAKKEVLMILEQLGKNNVIIRYSDPGSNKKQDYAAGLTENDLFLIRNTFEKSQVAASKSIEGVVYEANERVKVDVMAVTASYGTVRQLSIHKGRFLCDLDIAQKKLVCVLGYEVAKSLGVSAETRQYININQALFHVVGVLFPREIQKKGVPVSVSDYNQAIFIPLGSETSISRKQATDYDGIHEIILQQNMYEISSLGNAVKCLLMRQHRSVEDFQIVIPQELLKQEQHARKTFSFILAAIAALSLLIGGIGIVNIMLAMVSERTQEIGIRRAIGANRAHILFQFLMEALILTSIGTLLGLILGVTLSLIMSYLASWSVVITIWSIATAIGMSTLAGVFSGLYPAYIAANMDPITALRQR